MDFACDRCRRAYFVPDELVAGRALFRAKCTVCGHAFEVKVGAERPPAAPPVAPGAAPRAPEAGPGANDGEMAIAAYERSAAAHRRRNLLLAGGGALALVAAAAALVLLLPVRDAPVRAARARVTASEETAGAAPYADASRLLLRPDAHSSVPPPRPRGAPAERKARPRVGRDDRRLLDLLARKDDVAVAVPEGDPVDSDRSALDPEAVERTVAASRKAFDACISKAMRLDPTLRLSRRATLVLTVQPSGGVIGAFVAEEQVDRTELGACLCEAARRMVFPAFEGEPLDVTMPLSLSAVF